MTPAQHDLLDTELAIARMILADVGRMDEQLIRWRSEMEKVDPQIFSNLEAAWVKRHKKQIRDYYMIPEHSLSDYMIQNHMPIAACMDETLIGISQLPRPPRWLRKYARENVSHTLGFATSKLYPDTSGRDIPGQPKRSYAKSGMHAYFRLFSRAAHSLPNEAWFDQACHDREEMARSFPHLYWLARELVFREDPASSLEAMDDRLEFFQVPEVPRPSKKTLARFLDKLKEPDGSKFLAFARGVIQELDRIGDDHSTYYGILGIPSLYRAAIFPRFIRLLNVAFKQAGSVSVIAEVLIQNPSFYTFQLGRPQGSGIMQLGRFHLLRTKFPDRNPKPVAQKQEGCVIRKPELSDSIFPGCLWMIAAARDPADVAWLLPVCAKALRNEDVAHFNRLVTTVGEIASPDAIRGLARLRAKTRHATMLKQLNVALAQAAERSGLTTAEAEELVALTYGLDEQHCRVEPLVGGVTATLTLAGSGQAVIRYADPLGALLSKPPASIKADAQSETTLRDLRADAKSLTADMAIHRQRLERSWLTGQSWTWSAFQQRWLAHPVLSWLARRQIWLVAYPDLTVFTCMIGEDGGLYGSDGTRLPVPHGDLLLSLWHPLHNGVQDGAESSCVTLWRQQLKALKIEQPIRQAWRETYTLTQEERESSPASYRYARRILNQAQVVEIGRKRGWRIRNLSPHMPSSESAPWAFSLPAHGIYADWRTGGVGIDHLPHGAGTFSHIITDRLRFCVLEDGGNWLYDGGRKLKEMQTPVRLGDIPPVVFSEIMRDLDLMISIAASDVSFNAETIYAIPDLGVWRRQAGLADIPLPKEPHFGALAASRRDEIAVIVKSMKVDDRLRFEGPYIMIEGKRHQYRLHLGSADVMILPDLRHLFLSTTLSNSARQKGSAYKPLHDDDRLDLILQRIIMLLNDDRIRDKDILAQFASL
ncbi:hypothetical protein APT_10009 (plasmid) [Acetobacter pasteurianus NBRC 101655]|uniref:DUF4132 domain-containing protein n=2 Tax=Acetobacter TaxID=434 RepID=A0A2G4REH9_9PROT|nr:MULTISPECIES: DUF4132 domain-containing protein [Acetobacter]BAU39753.1 hypothetical protein APT_10009 [Acetobacter pasteurianus NBRC 101655]ANA15292.1 hypothetical protein WG31_14260 [Acetobacter oryzifermentans]PHY94989.1 DUF4132 domain-containing protein [Acetobacter pomorum]CCT60977.1 hypothetical protein APA386B_1P204 [Acetobacter pasteurianus 386B]GBR54177.1 hypothetical protein AA11825_2614 [Acetobacter pomorum DSM 11825]